MASDLVEAVGLLDSFRLPPLTIERVSLRLTLRRSLRHAYMLRASGPRTARRGSTITVRVSGRVPRGGELDHNVAYPDGPTAAQGMVGFCTGHHRGKHQAPGWRYDLSAEGTLTVTTPTGMVASTDPPPF